MEFLWLSDKCFGLPAVLVERRNIKDISAKAIHVPEQLRALFFSWGASRRLCGTTKGFESVASLGKLGEFPVSCGRLAFSSSFIKDLFQSITALQGPTTSQYRLPLIHVQSSFSRSFHNNLEQQRFKIPNSNQLIPGKDR